MTITAGDLSEREARQLVLLAIRDDQAARCFEHPEHDADVWVGMVWVALGVYWRPSEWELDDWSDRSYQQSYSHTFRRLRVDKGLVGRYEEPQEVGPVAGLTLDPAGYYWPKNRAVDLLTSGDLKTPKDLKRTCSARGCDRWLPPTELRTVCDRCRFGRKYRFKREYTKYSGDASSATRRGPGYEKFVDYGLADVLGEGLLSQHHASIGYGLMEALRTERRPPLLEQWKTWYPDGIDAVAGGSEAG